MVSGIRLSFFACVALVATTALGQPRPIELDGSLGGVGDRCGFRGDCLTDLRCIEGTCVDPMAATACGAHAECGEGSHCAAEGICMPGAPPGAPSGAKPPAPSPSPGPAPRSAPTSAPGPAPAPNSTSAGGSPPAEEKEYEDDYGPSDWEMFRLEGNHFFVGVKGGAGLTVPIALEPVVAGRVAPAAFAAVRLGGLFDTTELALEISPMSYWLSTDAVSGLVVDVTVGELAELDEQVFWPVRLGAGFLAQPSLDHPVRFLAMADLIGIAFNYGHLLFDVSLPSFRFCTEFDQVGAFSWLGTLGVSYVL